VIEVEYEEGKRLAVRQRCGECDGVLTLAWGGAYKVDGFVLVCLKNLDHHTMARPGGGSMESSPDTPGWSFSKERRRELEKEVGTDKYHQLMKYQGRAVITRDEQTEIIETLWPEAPPVEKKKALLLCMQYNLNPLLKHIYILGPFKDQETGEPSFALALGIKTKRLMARRQKPFSYIDDTPRMMTPDEQMKVWGKVWADRLCAITKLRALDGSTADGYGTWPKGKKAYGENKGNSPENMAHVRSESAALDRLCPDTLPQGVDVMDERFVEAEAVKTVDTRTGEIIEGEKAEDNLFDEAGEGQGAETGKALSEEAGGGQAEAVTTKKAETKKPAERTRPGAAKTYPETAARAKDKTEIFAAASHLKWDGKRLAKEVQERTGMDKYNLDLLPDDQLHSLASTLTDMADAAG